MLSGLLSIESLSMASQLQMQKAELSIRTITSSQQTARRLQGPLTSSWNKVSVKQTTKDKRNV